MHFVVANIVRPLTALTPKQRSFLCKSLRVAGGWTTLCHLTIALAKVFEIVFSCCLNCCFLYFSCNICAPSVQAAPSLYGVLKVPILGRQLSALRAFHPVPCFVQRGPHFLDGCSILDLFVCNLEKNRSSWCHVRFRNVGSILMFLF